MSREKQVEEIAKIICAKCKSDTRCERVICTMAYREAEELYEKGYRKASDVALEVIGEVVSKAKAIFCPDCDYDVADIRYNLDWLEAELKKKYTEQ